MQVSDVLTLGGATILVTIAVEVVKRTLAMTEAQTARFGPLMSIGFGVLFVVGAAWSQTADIPNALLTGLLAGAAASGIYGYAKGGIQQAQERTMIARSQR
jgi:hypothetical protein